MKANQPRADSYLPRLWRLVGGIPRGAVVTYGDVAQAVGVPCTARRVGWALSQAPRALELPWHRVLSAGGRIALPGAAGMEQRMRLRAEGVGFSGNRVRMDLHHDRKLGRSAARRGPVDL